MKTPKGTCIKPDIAVLIALNNLKDDPHFKIFAEWLNKSEARCEEQYLWETEEPTRTLWQGRCQMVKEINATQESALETLQQQQSQAKEK